MRPTRSHKLQASSLTAVVGDDRINLERNNMQTIKTQLTNINDELLKFYNRPGMALHFQPSNLKKLKEIIEKLIFLEEVIGKE